jgi:hemoglobin-like flavoprotein
VNAALLRESFTIILARDRRFIGRFYDKLFALHPHMRPLFTDRPQQEKMLARTLVAVLDRLDDAPWLDDQLHSLGRRHAHYRVTPAMFPVFQRMLLATLAESAGRGWTPEVGAAWSEALEEIASKVRRGMGQEADRDDASAPRSEA